MDSDATGGTSGDRLSSGERAELDELRAEVVALRSEIHRARPRRVRVSGHPWRWTLTAVLLLLVTVLAISTVTARFVRGELLDTDRYLSTVAPLGSDPVVQNEVATSITDEILARVDIEAVTADALAALTESVAADRPRVDRVVEGLAPVIAREAHDFVGDTVLSYVRSDQFEDLWVQANRAAHTALVAVLTGRVGPSSVSVDENGTVTLSLRTVIQNVKARLVERGFAFAEKIPEVDKQFVLFRSPDLVHAQRAVRALDKSAAVLPWVTIAVGVAALAAVPGGRRRRALSLVGLALAVGMLILAIALIVARALYLDRIPSDVLSPDAAAVIADAVVAPLRAALRGVGVLGLVIALAAYLSGSSASAATVRRAFGQGMDATQRLWRTRPPSSAQIWAYRVRVPLRWAIVGLAALVLAFWPYPTGLVVVWIVLATLLILLVVEVVIRPARTRATPSGDDDPDVVRRTTA